MRSKPLSLSQLILEATRDGYDVSVRVTKSRDGGPGRISIPTYWAGRFADAEEIDEDTKPLLGFEFADENEN